MAAPEPRPVVVVTGALAPYTQILYEDLARRLDRPLHVLACSAREAARHWTLAAPRLYRFDVLPGWRWHRSAETNHYVNPSVAVRIHRLRPAVLVLNDFSPTMLMAAGAARLLRIPYGVRTDGVAETDPGRRSRRHRMVRRALVGRAAFGLGPSTGSQALLARYGLRGPFAWAPLFPAWTAARPAADPRPYDVLFCGALNDEVKGARFFTDVILACAARGRRLRVRVTGDGPLRGEMERRLAAAGIAVRFDGFLQQGELAESYGSAHLFHFPTRGDVWGLVVHEALQSGAAVIASPHSGIARDVVAARACGLVLPLAVEAWADATLALLDEPARRAAFGAAARPALEALTSETAGRAYLDVLRPLLGHAQGPNSTSSV